MRSAATLAIFIGLLPAARCYSAEEDASLRTTFGAFVTAQNAHDEAKVEQLLVDSPSFLWITRGAAIWGRAAAMARFRELYAGTWHLEPDMSAFRVVMSEAGAAQIFVPVVFTMGPAGQPPQEVRFLMNQTLIRGKGVWRIASILPIPSPAPPQ